MTIETFLKNLLKSQTLSTEQTDQLIEHRKEVEGYLREEFGNDPKIRYAGSKAKGTMIADSYDLDIICYFPHETDKTLKEIHDEVEEILSSQYLIERKASAVRVKKIDEDVETDYHIDVVPGRFIDDSETDAFLHVVYGEKERMQTNIDTHVAYIRDSGAQEIIKLLKIWKVRNDVPIKTFVLEIFTVKALEEVGDKSDYADNVKLVLTKLGDEIETIKLEDPANSNNIVTEDIDASSKSIIASKAKEAIELVEENKDDTAGWESVFIGNDAELAKAIREGAFVAGGSSIFAKTDNVAENERKIDAPQSWRD